MRATCWLAIAGLLLVGCSGTNPGGGTRTLFVTARAETDGSTDGTRFGVEVRQGSKDGTVITDAVVIVRGGKLGDVVLPWEGLKMFDWAVGSYYLSGFAWEPGMSLEVRRGQDRLDASLEFPGFTTLTDPIGGTTFRKVEGKPFVARWKDSFGHRAHRVSVRLDEAKYERLLDGDPGAHEVDALKMSVDDRERIRVERVNEVELAGGVPGSVFRAASRHHIDFRVE